MKKILFFCLMIFCVIFSGCKKKPVEPELDKLPKVEEIKSDHIWYYFNDSGFAKIDEPQNAPVSGDLAYTEALRISSANNATNDDSGNKAFAVVNRLGILCFDGKNISLAKDISVFKDRTAGNLVFMNNKPIFSVYKSSFFNDTISKKDYQNDSNQHLFLIQFDELSKISYPIISCNNLFPQSDCEVVDYVWNGTDWICCIKAASREDSKTDFSYIKFTPSSPLLSLTPVTADSGIVIEKSDVSEYRNALAQKAFSNAPERIRKMLESFSSNIPFVIEVKSAGGVSPRIYENNLPSSMEKELNAKAIIAESWSAVLFEDGTLYIEGALPGKHILRGGKPIAIRLPKLDPGFIYSDFVISGTNLYAAWEETDFYKVKRSGFIAVDLDSTLYSKLR